MDHALWRSEEVSKAAIIKYPDVCAASLLAFGSVWSMHFIGMASVTLEKAPICYDWSFTMLSLAIVWIFMVLGIKVAGNDIFATPDREKILRDTLGSKYLSQQEAMWEITRITYFHKLHFLFFGSILAALGAVGMHYTGMWAQRGPFQMEFNIAYVAASVVAAFLICFAGFWIIFRLRWRIHQQWLRYVSAGVIALAVCALHFFGMLSATYYADNDKDNICQDTWDQSRVSPSSWTYFQMVVMALGIVVPSLALWVQNTISQELILAYGVASRSSAIISSLFPEKFRDQLFANDKAKLKNFLKTDSTSEESEDETGMVYSDSKPIADLYTDTSKLKRKYYCVMMFEVPEREDD